MPEKFLRLPIGRPPIERNELREKEARERASPSPNDHRGLQSHLPGSQLASDWRNLKRNRNQRRGGKKARERRNVNKGPANKKVLVLPIGSKETCPKDRP